MATKDELKLEMDDLKESNDALKARNEELVAEIKELTDHIKALPTPEEEAVAAPTKMVSMFWMTPVKTGLGIEPTVFGHVVSGLTEKGHAVVQVPEDKAEFELARDGQKLLSKKKYKAYMALLETAEDLASDEDADLD